MRAATTARRLADRRRSEPRSLSTRSSLSPGPGDRRQRPAQLRGETCERLPQRRGPTDDHQRRAGRARVTDRSIGFAQPPPGAIALHGAPQLSTHREPGAGWLGRFAPEDDEGRTIDALTSLEERLEIGAGGQPLASGKTMS